MAAKRETFGAAAARVGAVAEAPPPVHRNPHACDAHGCPIAGSIVIDGVRQCYVHARVRERRDWDATTVRIRNRSDLVEISARLRRSGVDVPDADVLDAMRRRLPALDGSATRYAALALVEAMLISECATERAGDLLVRPETIRQATGAIHALLNRFTSEPDARPAPERTPGADDE